VLAKAGQNHHEGIGCCEAPRGTLFHHYQVDDNGLIEKVNLLIATSQNNLAMNMAVEQTARHRAAPRPDLSMESPGQGRLRHHMPVHGLQHIRPGRVRPHIQFCIEAV
jgi:hypothetical protein